MERAQGELSRSCWAEGLCWVESCSQVSAQVGLRGDPSCAHSLQTTECPSLPQARRGMARLWNDHMLVTEGRMRVQPPAGAAPALLHTLGLCWQAGLKGKGMLSQRSWEMLSSGVLWQG